MLKPLRTELPLDYKQLKQNLTAAREAGDINAEVDAQKDPLLRLTVEETRVECFKSQRQSED